MQSRQRRRGQARHVSRAPASNRLSFGVQSMVPHVLSALGRTHDPANVRARGRARARRRVRAPQPRPDLRHPRRVARRLAAIARRRARARRRPHQRVRAHGRARDRARPPGRGGRARARRRSAGRRVRARRRGARARPGSSGTRCRTGRARARSAATTSSTGTAANTSAIGCAAHGHTDGRRWWNVRTPERYIAAVEAGTSAVGGSEVLDPATRAEEAFSLALRTRAGAVAGRAAAADRPRARRAGPARDRGASGSSSPLRGRLLASDLTARLLLAGAAAPWPSRRASPASLALGTIEC